MPEAPVLFLTKRGLEELVVTICHGCPRTPVVHTYTRALVICEVKKVVQSHHGLHGAKDGENDSDVFHKRDGFTICFIINYSCFISIIYYCQSTIMLLHPQGLLSKYIEPLTQYGIKHFRMYPGRSAKCYVNPLNDLFRLPTITIQRWLAADTGAHLSFCPIVSLFGAPYCERRGVWCPMAFVANGWSQRGSSHGNDAGRCNNVWFVSCFTPHLGFCPTYNPVHETQRVVSHACPSEFQPCFAQTSSFVQFTQQFTHIGCPWANS